MRDRLAADWDALLALAPDLLYALIVLAVFMVAGRVAGRAVAAAVRTSTRIKANDRLVRWLVTWVLTSFGVLAALGMLGLTGAVASVLATGGIAAIVLGFAFREIGENFLAGIFLTFSRPFEINDLLQSGDLVGHVREIALRYVHLRGIDGCDYYIPSAQIFREPLLNYTRDGLRRADFRIGVAYEDEPEEIVRLLQAATAAEPTVLPDPGPTVSITQFDANFIVYEVFFWINVHKSGFIATQNAVKIRCWRALRSAGMTFSSNVTSTHDITSLPPIAISGDPARR